MQPSRASRQRRQRGVATVPAPAGLTLIELLVVMSIIVVLAGVVLGAASIVRKQSFKAQAQAMVRNLTVGLETYAADDDRHRFPLEEILYTFPAPPPPSHEIGAAAISASYPEGIVGLLTNLKMLTFDSAKLTASKLLPDPWGSPYRYQLMRPTPAANVDRLADWNWDADAVPSARERKWDSLRNRPAPYPYVWSVGAERLDDDAKGWLYVPR